MNCLHVLSQIFLFAREVVNLFVMKLVIILLEIREMSNKIQVSADKIRMKYIPDYDFIALF